MDLVTTTSYCSGTALLGSQKFFCDWLVLADEGQVRWNFLRRLRPFAPEGWLQPPIGAAPPFVKRGSNLRRTGGRRLFYRYYIDYVLLKDNQDKRLLTADSDDPAQGYRHDHAHRSDLIPRGIPI
ncbi:hypothetical protein CDQ92_01780 [Sphingopyxis bauzanensis]|uniref:Uncharacterized protein n=1 Tax=Sphingopyxis bauzanensis TaxID=651663 RepID=A0A246K0B5_9SPHN|nr:hypothetical protein [Sphingopyxis bauzanensis]OWQ98940.1 hypothetical protein CDQ92_01780 [Sphingopyxis bauzanensis]